MPADPTLDPALTSWLPVGPASDFPVQNLPFGVVRTPDGRARCATRVGDTIVDLAALHAAGSLDVEPQLPDGLFDAGSLNAFVTLGRMAWRAVRERLSDLLRSGPGHEGRVPTAALLAAAGAEMSLPVQVGDYVDFYSSLEHATNMGRMLRPTGDALNPNWRWMPVGYQGRAGSVVVSGTAVHRPIGQLPPDEVGAPPRVAPTERLDFELEVGFVAGPGNERGRGIAADDARDHVFGLVLVNDWSARDIQRWEYVPLGPFLGKSFATTVSPWIVTLDALEPFRVVGPPQDPPPPAYLDVAGPWAFDVDLEVEVRSATTPEGTIVSRTNLRHLYWNVAQQLAHATVNGATVRPGDLLASGTISGPEPGSYGSLMELGWNGTRPVTLADGSPRSWLEDGDTVILRGHAGGKGKPRIGFGEAAGTILGVSHSG